MRRIPIPFLVALAAALAACSSPPPAKPSPDEFEDVLRAPPEPTSAERLAVERAPRLTGMVTGVREDLNIVLLSVGRDDGVRLGDVFRVFRGDEYVARIVVDKVENDYASGYSEARLEKSPIRVGDLATLTP